MHLQTIAGFIMMASALMAWAVLADDERDRLCVNQHPRPRSTAITYGGKPIIHGYERDHIIPLCLGGADKDYNVRYQPLDQATISDVVERNACRDYCAGRLSLRDARKLVSDQKESTHGSPTP